MALYTADSRDRIRDAVDFIELVSARTDLRRAGPNNYEGLCPFHEERTPSFGIDPVQKVYYCFGCQAGGDLFTFVQETENVDFKGALELLADRAGIELEREAEDPREAQRRQRRERLLQLLARTSAYYERCLWESPEAARPRDYLLGRGLQEEVLREFHVGYAPSAWDRVLTGSLRGGFSEAELYAAGLAQRSQQGEGRLYDRFRARITFPLADMRGRVLGFGARVLDGAAPGELGGGGEGERGSQWGGEAGPGRAPSEAATGRRPKYLNTTDNDLYHKGEHLYGADLARAHASKANEVILCEGYTDVIALRQAGFRNAVGLMGTALTDSQVTLLARMAKTVLIALDADAAGQGAMLKAAVLARKRDTELRVVPLPDGRDPAELVLQAEGREAMSHALQSAIPFERFQVERVLAGGDHGSSEGRERMLAQLKDLLGPMPMGTMKMDLTRLASEGLRLPQSLAEQAFAVTTAKVAIGARAGGGRSAPLRTVAARGEGTERAFLALCIADPSAGAPALAELDPVEHFTSDLMRRACRHLRDHLADPGAGLPAEDPELAALIAEIVVEAGREPPAAAMLESQRMQLELARIDREIVRARASGEQGAGQAGAGQTGAVSELARRRAEVKRKFDRAYERALEQTG